MPFFTVNTSLTLSEYLKKEIIHKVTEITTMLLDVPPDKIQVITQELSRDNWGKAGATLEDSNFSEKSRLINWNSEETYYNGDLKKEDMVLIKVDVWSVYNQEQKDKWVKQLTDYFTGTLKISKDNILILIRDMVPGNWAQTGITGANENFLNYSRLNK